MAKCKGLWFGTAERMMWLPAPSIDMGMTPVGWGASGTFLNGGGYVRRSQNTHQTYSMSWPMKRAEELYPLKDYYNGVYGDGPFHMLLPGTYENVLPAAWAVPRMALSDGPLLVRGEKPVAVSVGSVAGRPAVGVRYTITESTAERRLHTVALPPDMYLHLGVYGSVSGGASVQLNGQAITPIAPANTALTNTVVSTAGLLELSIQGEGEVELVGMTAYISDSAAPPAGTFVSGRGTSAVDFEPGSLDITMSSAAKNYYHGSATLVEVGQWA